MSEFLNIEYLKSNATILLFGSYREPYYQHLLEIKGFLKQNGISKVFLVNDLVDLKDIEHNRKNKIIYEKVREFQLLYDYNIFVLFEEIENKSVNESVLVELTTLLNCQDYEIKSKKTLVLKPKNYHVSMLLGMLDCFDVIVYEYFDIFELSSYIYRFISNNL